MEAAATDHTRTSEPEQHLPDNLVRDMDRDELSRLIRDANDAGVSYQAMAERAETAGLTLSKPYFQKLATNSVSTAPTPDRLRAIAAAVRMPLAVVKRAAARQYLDYEATELAGYDDETRVIVAHLAGMEGPERRRWRAMIEADKAVKEADE
ncbi:hypothetical protein [Streptomyces zhihengii]|jgi:hypothetical protein|uniref:hypothetical protein n=1 Tax=Streptomyces zhihengii TaxID=1818004 RepID=UPI00363D45AA